MRPLPRAAPTILAGMLAVALSFVGSPAQSSVVIGKESASAGFTGNLFPGKFPGYTVASDGESPFLPFGVTFDVSDGLNFSTIPHVWKQVVGGKWTNIGFQTWVLPANLIGLGCGSENEPVCEPVGHFVSPDRWVPAAIGTCLTQLIRF